MRAEALPEPLAAGGNRLASLYLYMLMAALAGYAVLGKGFAYLGVAPLYMGELTLLAGVLVFLRLNCFVGVLASWPAVVLVGLVGWVVARTVPYIGSDGVNALRDSVVVTYGGFAFIMIALLLSDAARIGLLLRHYGRFISVLVPATTYLYLIDRYFDAAIPCVPGTDIPILGLEPGEPAVHLCGAIVFMLAGLRRSRPLWNGVMLVSLGITAALSRGPMLAAFIPTVLACLLLGKARQLLRLGAVALALFAVAYAVEPLFYRYEAPESSQTRPISTRQIVANVEGTFGSGDAQGQGTKEWRVEFWHDIMADTLDDGPRFWTGRGFGLNLAEAYGFPGHNDPNLRDPHNVVMTMLARSGVPGAALWLLFVAAWFWEMLRAMLLARRRGNADWAGLFVWVMAYALSLIINACFDPSLEGPMQGVWFWCLVGFGLGSAMIYRQSERPLALITPAALSLRPRAAPAAMVGRPPR